jgi:hypothetical protein
MRVPLKIQDIVLQGGDVLLISCPVTWTQDHRHDKAFVLLQVYSASICSTLCSQPASPCAHV